MRLKKPNVNGLTKCKTTQWAYITHFNAQIHLEVTLFKTEHNIFVNIEIHHSQFPSSVFICQKATALSKLSMQFSENDRTISFKGLRTSNAYITMTRHYSNPKLKSIQFSRADLCNPAEPH